MEQTEIKFRFLNTDYVNNPIIEYGDTANLKFVERSIGKKKSLFTGLLDKNEKEIYAGEILFNDDRKEHCVVKWSEEEAMFITEYVVHKDCFPLSKSLSNLYCSVGNVYENPELLK